MPCTSVYDFINGGVIELVLSHPPVTDWDRPGDGHHGLRPLLAPDDDACALLRDHAKLLADRMMAH